MFALGLGLIAALIWAVHDLLARKLTQNAELLPINLLVLGSGCVVLAGPSLAFGEWSRLTGNTAALAVAAGVVFAIASGTLFRAFSMAPARIVAPIIGAYPMLSLGSAVMQSRHVTVWEWLCVLAICLGIAVVSMTSEKGESTQQRSHFPAIMWSVLSACGFAATFAISQEAARQGSELAVIFITRVVAFGIIGVVFLAHRSNFSSLQNNWKLVAMMGVFDMVALALVTVAGKLRYAEYATVTSSLFGVLTIIFASMFLNEKLRTMQWFGVVVVFAGIGFLSAQT